MLPFAASKSASSSFRHECRGQGFGDPGGYSNFMWQPLRVVRTKMIICKFDCDFFWCGRKSTVFSQVCSAAQGSARTVNFTREADICAKEFTSLYSLHVRRMYMIRTELYCARARSISSYKHILKETLVIKE